MTHIPRSSIAHLLCEHGESKTRCVICNRIGTQSAEGPGRPDFIGDALPKPGPGTFVDRCLLVFPLTLPGLNDILKIKASRYKGRWNNEKVKWQEKVAQFWVSAGRPKFKGAVRLTWWFYEPSKRRDPSNVAAAAEKIILDGLVNAGCLPGDGWNWIAPPNTQHWAHSKKNPRIELRIECVDEF